MASKLDLSRFRLPILVNPWPWRTRIPKADDIGKQLCIVYTRTTMIIIIICTVLVDGRGEKQRLEKSVTMPRRSAFLMETKRNESREKNIFVARRRRRPEETYIGTPSDTPPPTLTFGVLSEPIVAVKRNNDCYKSLLLLWIVVVHIIIMRSNRLCYNIICLILTVHWSFVSIKIFQGNDLCRRYFIRIVRCTYSFMLFVYNIYLY